MMQFRVLLVTIFIAIAAYPLIVVANHGLGLFPVFFGDIADMGWPGQFNLDFLGFLTLSAFWLAWRNDFTPAGLALGVFGFFLGAPFLAAYLFFVSRSADNDPQVLLLGPRRAAR
jgi:hypothetical protein